MGAIWVLATWISTYSSPIDVGVDAVSWTFAHALSLQCNENGVDAMTRNNAPAGTHCTCRFIFHTSMLGRGLSLRYRSATGSITSKTFLSAIERNNFT